MKKKISAILLLAIIFCSMFMLVGCNPDDFSEEEHIQRISKLVEKRYIENNEYTGYEVYPLFNEDDELAYFLVDLKPTGYVYVKLRKTNPVIQLFGGASMYTRDDGDSEIWQRYRIAENGEEPMPYEGIQWEVADPDENGIVQYPNRRWEVDETGKFKYYNISHFKAANIGNEKKYLLKIEQEDSLGYIPAVKKGDKYLNLISMEEIDYQQEIDMEKYPYACFLFVPKKMCDL